MRLTWPELCPSPVPPVAEILQSLEALATPRDLANLQRFGITAANALGVSMANIQKVARADRTRPRDGGGAVDVGIYEARLLAAYVDDPAEVTPAQMDRWCRDFDNWGVVRHAVFRAVRSDAACVGDASIGGRRRRPEFVRRAAFALMASLAVHDKVVGRRAVRRALAAGRRGRV